MSVFDDPAKRDMQLRIMLTKAEKERLEAAADEFDMSLSDLIRRAVNDFVERGRAEKKKRKR